MNEQALLPQTIIDDRYEILSLAGEGGMGTVYKARHLTLDRIVAIKVLREEYAGDMEAVRRFKHEAQLVRELQQQNIAGVYGFGISNNRPYIVFEFLEGVSLQAVLAEQGSLPFDRFIAIFTQVCKGLEHAHKHGVIHRDLKPANIFLLQDEQGAEVAKIVDFGIAKQLDASPASQRLTKTGMMLGTPLYMSPEQGRGEPVTPASDIYSLGCVLYRAAYGKPPFEAESAYEMLFNHAYTAPLLEPVPEGYPDALSEVLGKALAKDPADRYAGAAELAAALEAISKEKPVRPARVQKSTKAAKSSKSASFTLPSPRLFALPLGVVVAAGVAFAAWAWWQNPTNMGARITAEWRQSKDARRLQKSLNELAQHNAEEANAVLESLHTELEILPDPAIADCFFDAETRHFMKDRRNSDNLNRGLLVVRLLPSQVWESPDGEGARLAKRYSELNSMSRTHNASIKMLPWVAHNLLFDDNYPAAVRVTEGMVDQLRREPVLAEQSLDPLLMLSEQFAQLDDKKHALDTIDCINLDYTPQLGALVARKKAELYDIFADYANGAIWWQKALDYVNKSEHPDKALLATEATLGLADDLSFSDAGQAREKYKRVESLLNAQPVHGRAWMDYLRLADALSVQRQPDAAQGVYLRTLARLNEETSKIASGSPFANALALAVSAELKYHLRRYDEALADFARSYGISSRLSVVESTLYAQVLRYRPVIVEEAAAAALIKTKPPKEAAQAQQLLDNAHREITLAEWYELRGDTANAALHRSQAQDYMAPVLGAEARANALLAAGYYDRLRRYKDVFRVLKPVVHKLVFKHERTPESGEIEVLMGRACLRLGKYHEARAAMSHETLRRWFDQRNAACMAGYLDFAELFENGGDTDSPDEKAHEKNKALDDLKDAYHFAENFNCTGVSEFRIAALRIIKLAHQLGQDEVASNFAEDYLQKSRRP